MEDALIEAALSATAGNGNTGGIERSNPRWDDLCERCAQIPWESLARPEVSAVQPDEIRLSGTWNPETCRLCRLFALVYSHIPLRVPPEVLLPDDLSAPMYRFQRRLLRETMDTTSGNYDIRWILTDRDPRDEEVMND
jgi:hypothetical protein